MVDTSEENQEKRPNHRILVPLVLLVSGLVAAMALFHWAKRPKPIQKLVFEGLIVLTSQDLMEYLEIPSDPLDPNKLSWEKWEQKLNSHPRIQKARVNRNSDGRLIITLQERVAEFIVHVGDMLYEVDHQNMILSENHVLDPYLLTISGNFPISSNQIQGTQFNDIASVLRSALVAYPALKTRISEIQIEDDGDYIIFLKSPNPMKVLIGNTFNLYNVRKLYAALAYLETEEIKANEIDLRGEDAVYH